MVDHGMSIMAKRHSHNLSSCRPHHTPKCPQMMSINSNSSLFLNRYLYTMAVYTDLLSTHMNLAITLMSRKTART